MALLQRPGLASSDTKIDLHVDPGAFLGDVASAWSSTGDLGHVQGGQYGGYLFPMGPFFALGHALGAAPWLVQRLWLGLVLALAVLGVLHLVDLLAGRPRGIAHVVAGALTLLNPYVVVFAARTSVTLLGYAALPWLLVCLLRGLRAWPEARWRWPAAFALVVTASGGGVNAAVVGWILLGPLLLAGYEWWTGAAGGRAVAGFAWRAAVAGAAVSAWWVVPLLVQSRYGVDFLRFTEQPGTIWSTTSLSESLRLMGYWISYLGVGYGGTLRPYFGDGGVLLFALPVVLAGLLVPALALTGFAWTRRHPYGPFLLVLVIAGLIAMTAGFPEGTPLRRAANFTYNHVASVQFLRTTYKAGPLVALGIAGLAGLAAARSRALAVACVALAALASWPLMRGRGLDDQLLWPRVPAAWEQAAAHVDRQPDGRAVVLPGQLYAYYRWGGTIDPILPTLADRPVAVRNAVGYADLHAVDLLWTVDALVSQHRALPGQLSPLLDLLGARTVISGADDDRTRSGAAPAAEAAGVLDQLGRPDARWGRARQAPPAAGTLDAPRRLPQVRAWDRPGAPGLVRVEPRTGETVVDGSAEGLAGLAAFGPLPRDGVDYAGDLSPDELRRAGDVVITDSNRRRVLVISRLAQNTGATLAADEAPSVDAAVLDPFPLGGSDAQTVAVYDGIKSVSAPFSPGFPQFPERRPFAALDGDPATAWQADRNLTQDRHTLDVTFDRPRDVDHVDLMPYSDERATVTAVEVAGRRFGVHAGWNRLRLGLRGVRSLRVRIASIRKPADETAGAGGIRELRIPGVRATEALRVPVLAERALAGRDLSRTGLGYVFQRTTGDDPFRRDPVSGPAGAALVRDRGDGESGLERIFAPPAARTWTADGWASAASTGADDALDRLAGFRGPERFTSSGRFESRPGWRASSAFDGTGRPWIGAWLPGRATWLQWTTPQARSLRTLRLRPVPGVRRPTLVRLRWDGRASDPLPVAADGSVAVPAGVRGRAFRLDVLRAAFPAGTPGVVKQRRAVGIAEVEGPPRVTIPRAGALRGACGDLSGTVAGRPLRLRATGTVADLDAGKPLRMTGCGDLALPAGRQQLSLPPDALAPYLLRLRSPAPAGAAPAAAPGRVVSAGRATHDGRTGVRLDLHAPARLVLAEGYDRGRRASCDGHDLGTPRVGDAFGTAWDVPASCRDVEISFAPDRLVRAGYVISLIAGIVLLALVLFGRRRTPEFVARAFADMPPAPLPAKPAVIVAVVAGLALGFVFAARATPLFVLGVYVVLRRGIGARTLALAGGALLGIAVPVLTLLIRPPNRGGYNPEYATKGIVVHWVTVAGVSLLILALARALSTARARRDRARGAPPSAGVRPARAP
jgi:arabinofuranan 3-O-arabinosyltransferase